MHTTVPQAARSVSAYQARFNINANFSRHLHAASRRSYPRRTGPFEPASGSLDHAAASEGARTTEIISRTSKEAAVEGVGPHEGPRRIVEALSLRTGDRESRSASRLDRFPAVHIPKWFYKKNIKLAEDPLETKPRAIYNCSLSVRDEDGKKLLAAISVPVTAGDAFRAFENAKTWAEELVEADVATITTGDTTATKQKEQRDVGWTPPFWVQAEIQAAIIAGLTIARIGHLPFPAARSNILLHLPLDGGIAALSDLVKDIASSVGADVIQLGAQDLAELGADYLGDSQELLAHALRTLGFDTHRSPPIEDEAEAYDEDPDVEQQDQMSGFQAGQHSIPVIAIGNGKGGTRGIKDVMSSLQPLLNDIGRSVDLSRSGVYRGTVKSARQDELKLSFLLAALAESNELKRATAKLNRKSDEKQADFFTDSCPTESRELNVSSFIGPEENHSKTIFRAAPQKTAAQSVVNDIRSRKTILLVEDFKEIYSTQVGQSVLSKLTEIVMERRRNGQNIMLVGLTAAANLLPEKTTAGVRMLQTEYDTGTTRTIVVVPASESLDAAESTSDAALNEGSGSSLSQPDTPSTSVMAVPHPDEMSSAGTSTPHQTLPFPVMDSIGIIEDPWDQASRERTEEINLRHIRDMLRRIDPAMTEPIQDLGTKRFMKTLNADNRGWLGKAFSHEETHRICMTALGLRPVRIPSSEALAQQVNLAMTILRMSDEAKFAWIVDEQERDAVPVEQPKRPQSDHLKSTRASCNDHEKKLLGGVVDKTSIRTTFADVHAPATSIDSLKTLTSLSLQRPDAFKYGVLATDKIPGLLLYGPPGTGKTLLAKAVARESGATMLEVSGSEINDMYVGEGEKNVKAIFTLARKLSPCVVFIDEADAVFRSRSGHGGSRTAHREVINQFLREWDGMDDLSVFIMVATNRPYDLDDAVLRRLPRRLLVDLPTERDREAILGIHLKGEVLDADVSLHDLAARTPFYSGSDLKNLCVAAALACVREENDVAAAAAAAASEGTDDDKPASRAGHAYPARRTLADRHFASALQDISASVSEDMSSLAAIKKFDELYGDRRGDARKRRKGGWGFGPAGEGMGVNEELARVRV